MINKKDNKYCKYTKIKTRYIGGPIVMIDGLDLFLIFYGIYLFFKIKIKKIKKATVYKSEECNNYLWQCPYCDYLMLKENVPKFYTCQRCNKKSYFDPYLKPYFSIFRSSKKP